MKLFRHSIARVVAAFSFVGILTLSIYTVRSNVSSAPDYPTALISQSSPKVIVEIPAGGTIAL